MRSFRAPYLAAILLSVACPTASKAMECTTSGELEVRTSQSIFHHANDFRRGAGRSALVRYASLDDVARLYAEFLCESGQFDHVTEAGFDVLDRTRLHARDLFFSTIGENLYKAQAGRGSSIRFDLSIAEEKGRQIEEGWEDSPGHRANLLRQHYNGIGVGIAYTNSRIVGVQVFARVISQMSDPLEMVQSLSESRPLRLSFLHPTASGVEACLVQWAADEENDGRPPNAEQVMGCSEVRNWKAVVEIRGREIGLSNLDLELSNGLRAWGPRFVGAN